MSANSIAEKFEIIADAVYEKGYADGQAEGGGDYYIWDDLQSYGARKDYQYACRGWRNLKRTVKPNYDIRPTNIDHMFYATTCSDRFDGNEMALSIPELEKERGIKFDTSECTNFQYAFSYAHVSDTGIIDARSAKYMSQMYLGSTMVKTTHIILPENDLGANYGIGAAFNYNTGLENVTLEGKLFRSFNISWSTKLTKASIISIINALLESAEGMSVSFSKTAVNNAFGIDVDDESTFPEGSEYYELRNSKSNWTFNYV